MTEGTTVLHSISETILQQAINKQVADKMGSLAREMNEFTNGMSPDDSHKARLLLLECMQVSFGLFYEKMRKRIEDSSRKKFEIHGEGPARS